MVKCGKKSKAIGEVAVMEVGERTRTSRRSARALAMAEARTTKKRRVASSTSTPSTSELQFIRRRGVVNTPENKNSPPSSENSSAVCLNCDHSRCSSNGSSEPVNATSLRSAAADLVEEGFDYQDINSSSCLLFHHNRNRREMTPSSELRREPYDLESTTKLSSMANSQRSTVEKTPSQEEIDDFFSFAEKLETKRFADKYNYDVVKDSPMEGRYEWIHERLDEEEEGRGG